MVQSLFTTLNSIKSLLALMTLMQVLWSKNLLLISIGFINQLTLGGEKSRYLISSSDEGSIRFFDWKAKLKTSHLIKKEEPFEFHASTDLYLAAANSENEIYLYGLGENEMKPKSLHTFKDEYEGIFLSFFGQY